MKPGKEANQLLEVIVALKAQKRRLEQAIDLQRRILAGEKVIWPDPEQEKNRAVHNEMMLFGA